MAHFLGMFEMPNDILGQLIIYIVVLLFAISAHEAAHAWMSHRFGDDTAYLLGRVTLNPVKHTDPIGTLLIPIIGFVFGASDGAADCAEDEADDGDEQSPDGVCVRDGGEGDANEQVRRGGAEHVRQAGGRRT